jgi:hypothetical protein
MMEALSFSGTSVLKRATRRNVPEDAIPHRYRFIFSGTLVSGKASGSIPDKGILFLFI